MLATIFAFINAAIIQGIPLLFGATGEIITEKSGNLNLGIPGIMYMGGISGIIGGYLYEHSTDNPAVWLCILIPLTYSLKNLTIGSICIRHTTSARVRSSAFVPSTLMQFVILQVTIPGIGDEYSST